MEHISPEGDYLYRLFRATNVETVNPQMASGHIQGRLLKMLVEMMRPKNILEIGTFTGYSAICMAEGLQDGGKLYTFDIDDEKEDFTRKWIENSPVADKIVYKIGSALDEVPHLGVMFDLVFVDGDKREYPAYYKMLMDKGLVHSGSIMLADNILWYGKVVQPVAHNDHHTQALIEFNRMVVEDDRVESVILPLRDGINIIRVK